MGHGAKIAFVALLVLMVVAVAKFVQNGPTDEGRPLARVQPSVRMVDERDIMALAELSHQEASRQVIMCFGPDELWGEETLALFAREGLEITGMTCVVKDGNTVGVIVSLKKADIRKHP